MIALKRAPQMETIEGNKIAAVSLARNINSEDTAYADVVTNDHRVHHGCYQLTMSANSSVIQLQSMDIVQR